MMFKNREVKLRPFWKIILVLVCYYIFNFVFQTIVYFAHSFISVLYDNKSDSLLILTYFVLYILQCFAAMIAVYILWISFEHKPIREMCRKNNKMIFMYGSLMGLILPSTICLMIYSALNVKILGVNFNISLLLWLIVFILVGISEELLFRGYIMTMLRQMGSNTFALFVSSVIFASFHLLNPGITIIGFINIFLAGFLMGCMFIKVGLWMSIGFHITWNYTLGCIFSTNVSGLEIMGLLKTSPVVYNIYSGGAFGPEGSILTTMFLLAAILYVQIMTRKNEEMDV